MNGKAGDLGEVNCLQFTELSNWHSLVDNTGYFNGTDHFIFVYIQYSDSLTTHTQAVLHVFLTELAVNLCLCFGKFS